MVSAAIWGPQSTECTHAEAFHRNPSLDHRAGVDYLSSSVGLLQK